MEMMETVNSGTAMVVSYSFKPSFRDQGRLVPRTDAPRH